MADRILILTPEGEIRREFCTALEGLGAEVVGTDRWAVLEEELRRPGVRLTLLVTPLRGRLLADRIRRLRHIAPQLVLFALWWDHSEQGAVERLLAGINQIYTLPCAVERLRLRVAGVLQKGQGYA